MTKALNDRDLSAEDASMVGNLLKQSSSCLTPLGLTESVGHLAWADQPELFADMIIDWVNTGLK